MVDESEKSRTDWPPLIFLLVVLPLAVTWGGWKAGFAGFLIGAVWLGWSKRHAGPMPTDGGPNVSELEKIREATRQSPAARQAVAQALCAFGARVEEAKAEGSEALKQLLTEATNARHTAMSAGASSYGDPAWAAAAACESWLLEELTGSPSGDRFLELVRELSEQGDNE